MTSGFIVTLTTKIFIDLRSDHEFITPTSASTQTALHYTTIPSLFSSVWRDYLDICSLVLWCIRGLVG